jgi:two-component system osmolarity sensor histidine kinase EnvZ
MRRRNSMKRMFSSLMARVFIAQLLAVMAAILVFALLISYGLSRNFADGYADRWAPALMQWPAGDALAVRLALEDALGDRVIVGLQPPPAPRSRVPRFSMRFNALADELRARGVPLTELRVSGRSGRAVIWLALSYPGEPARWLGVASPVEGAEIPARVLVWILVCLCIIASLAWALSRWLTAPMRGLAQVMRRVQQGDRGIRAPEAGTAEHRALAQGFNQMMDAVAAAERERDIMLAGVSHDLRSPLTRIRMAAEMLPDAAARERIARNVEQADQVLASFLDFVRLDHAPLSDPIHLADLLDELGAANAMTVEQVKIDIPGRIELCGHALLLQRAIQNLLDNALRYGSAPVELQAFRQADSIFIEVSDGGPGMSADEVQDALKPFVRLPTHREGAGSGLGLAIVDRVVRRHGGRLTLARRGERFVASVELPLTGAAQTTPG